MRHFMHYFRVIFGIVIRFKIIIVEMVLSSVYFKIWHQFSCGSIDTINRTRERFEKSHLIFKVEERVAEIG